jgi:hypothetical protein
MSRSTPEPDQFTPHRAAPRPVAAHAPEWREVLQALHEAGQRAGANAADWWAQDTVGGRATGDTAGRARAVLAGIDDGDPAVLDALPVCDLSGRWADTPTEADSQASRYTEMAPPDAPSWNHLDAGRRDEAIEAYRDGFDTACPDRVAEHCHTAIPADPAPPNTAPPDPAPPDTGAADTGAAGNERHTGKLPPRQRASRRWR